MWERKLRRGIGRARRTAAQSMRGRLVPFDSRRPGVVPRAPSGALRDTGAPSSPSVTSQVWEVLTWTKTWTSSSGSSSTATCSTPSPGPVVRAVGAAPARPAPAGAAPARAAPAGPRVVDGARGRVDDLVRREADVRRRAVAPVVQVARAGEVDLGVLLVDLARAGDQQALDLVGGQRRHLLEHQRHGAGDDRGRHRGAAGADHLAVDDAGLAQLRELAASWPGWTRCRRPARAPPAWRSRRG